MNIAVVGGGISGMASAYLINKNISGSKVTLITNDKNLGGEYDSGGLKYVHFNWASKRFFDQIGIQYSISKVIGAVLYNEIEEPFFEFFYYNKGIGQELQSDYWEKTRGDVTREIDRRCMNDVWSYRNDLKIEPIGGIGTAIDILKNLLKIECYDIITNYNVCPDDINIMLNKYDYIIYTIPVYILLNAFHIKYNKHKMSYKQLNISSSMVSNYDLRRIWWDYLYVPSAGYKFHRISKGDGCLYIETNSNSNGKIENEYSTFMKKHYGIGANIDSKFSVNIKGQISVDNDFTNEINAMTDKIVLLGRYAEWNKRITFDKVLERIYDFILPEIKGRINGHG